MSFSDLFGSGEHTRNVSHFASIVRLAIVDGDLNEEEFALLGRFSRRLDISVEEYKKILKNPEGYPINPPDSKQKRLERLHDLFKIIFADREIDDEELNLVSKYAIGLGFSDDEAVKIIKRSVDIMSGHLSFEDYEYLLNR
ncbi:TerB family tellurite resistance protein [Gangjinia marincola]|uniref:TerB family tellurite resistance protein n=1 Tax=Gangjinia marincola TaxID=578463 RepID=A0ABP3XZJ6_9FLAO